MTHKDRALALLALALALASMVAVPLLLNT